MNSIVQGNPYGPLSAERLEAFEESLGKRLPNEYREYLLNYHGVADVEVIARFFGNLHGEFRRDFVVGISDAQTGIAEDLYCIADSSPDLEMLARVIGLRPIH